MKPGLLNKEAKRKLKLTLAKGNGRRKTARLRHKKAGGLLPLAAAIVIMISLSLTPLQYILNNSWKGDLLCGSCFANWDKL
jgi:hypothetical protein